MKSLVEQLLWWTGVVLYRLGLDDAIRRLRSGPRVLLYHAVEPREGHHLAGLDSNTTPEVFERQLDYLARHHQVVPLSALEEGRCPRDAAVVTFDDGYRSVLTEAHPRLKARGFPSVLYVVAEAVGNHRPVWVNELAWRLNQSPEAREAAARALDAPADASPEALVARAVAAYEPAQTASLMQAVRTADGARDAAAAARAEGWYVSWDDARTLSAEGMTIGNHTASHPVLAGLDPTLQDEEMRRGREAVVRELGACSSLAYPFGSYDEHSARIAAGCGHRSVMLVGERAGHDPFAVGRVPVRSHTAAGIFAELEVVAPVKAALRRLVRGKG